MKPTRIELIQLFRDRIVAQATYNKQVGQKAGSFMMLAEFACLLADEVLNAEQPSESDIERIIEAAPLPIEDARESLDTLVAKSGSHKLF